MRKLYLLSLLAPLALAACGSDTTVERTVVVSPRPAVVAPSANNAVVVPSDGTQPRACQQGVTC
jgi:uncharacterized protein YcfL